MKKNIRLRGPSLGSVVLFKMGAVNAGPPQYLACSNQKVVDLQK